MPYLPDISATAHNGMGRYSQIVWDCIRDADAVPRFGRTADFLSVACGGVMAGLCLTVRFFSRRGRSKHVGAGERPIKPATGVMEVDSIISGNCSTCWPVNKTNC
jgi:hypothetical protein